MPAKFVGDRLQPRKITGYLMAWYTDHEQPVLLRNMPSEREPPLLPIFSTIEKLEMAMTWMRPDGPWKIKQIDDGPDFLDSVKGQVLVAADPWQKDGGKIGFFGVFFDTETQ